MTDNTVLCIGLDAACFEQITPLVEQGDMPNLERLLDQGVSGPLVTTTPPWTPSAWPSITTGTTPWTHGIYDFYDHTGEQPQLVSARDLHVPYLWDYLDAAGETPIVVNVPVTHPIYRMSGSVVPGYLAPEGSDVLIDGEPSPQSTLAEDYRIYARKTDTREETIAENERLVESRVTVAETLADRHDWSFMMVQFQRTDAIFHTMGHDSDAVRRVYRAVDRAIGRLLALVDDDATVIVVSDHGIHEYERTFRCNTWLRDRGQLQTAAESERHSWGETTKPTADGTDGAPSTVDRLLGASLTALRRVGLTPQRADKALSVVGLAEPIRRLLPDELILNAADHVDWSASEAYCRSVSSLGIRCNVDGRDPDGVIPAEQFEEVREELISALRAVRAPDGEPVFETVYDRHDRHGSDVPNERSAPDIVFRPNRMAWKVTDVVREPVFEETDEFSHTYEGLFVATGPSIDPADDVELDATAVAPLVLQSFGYRPAPVMDGTVPPKIRNATALTQVPEPGEHSYLSGAVGDDAGTVTDRLEQLGYLE
ncbi:alkaline phosphatase family protein [Halapricum desulfuricans]|uniref:Phosphodiesterase of AP superfamily n=1 Tax=Halapricum desulfuricans TaxID=2841257 RepID=A0A897MXW0_9EURY|nr:alkaline phosphatase family protein [Halapricum desulfuricans]QSG05101.1 Phosphodiesterase of AP superfamily [Halapricum desulfuricans]